MRIQDPENYTIKNILVAKDGKHKYVAILENKQTKREKKIPFGDISYEHYRDALGFYSDLDHMDKKRQANFLSRHAKNIAHKFSSGWFSKVYLWT
jgi:hypothetical protein